MLVNRLPRSTLSSPTGKHAAARQAWNRGREQWSKTRRSAFVWLNCQKGSGNRTWCSLVCAGTVPDRGRGFPARRRAGPLGPATHHNSEALYPNQRARTMRRLAPTHASDIGPHRSDRNRRRRWAVPHPRPLQLSLFRQHHRPPTHWPIAGRHRLPGHRRYPAATARHPDIVWRAGLDLNPLNA